MRCSSCAAENAPDRRFCAECGAPLALVCPACRFENQPSAKFCGGCGARLGLPAAAPVAAAPESYTPKPLAERILRSRGALEGERKQVTVLFADIKGSMELIQSGDPEEARRILDPTIAAMMGAVHRYEGTVNKVLGDGIMALFGAPLAHEDHAVRACYAALAMQNALRALSERTRRDIGIEVQVRIGLHSGEVVVRAIGNDLTMDYDAIGPTTHLASRMEQLAPPGAIRLTADTLRLAEGLVQVRALGPIPVKGLPQPIEAFELTGAAQFRSRLQASAAAGFTRFVGRDREMDALNAALERAGAGMGQLIAVVGEPGIGKSRLYYEFVRSHRTGDWLVLESGSVSHGKATAYLPVVDLLKNYFQIEGADDARRIREKITGKVLTLDESLRPTLPAFFAVLDVPVDDPAWTESDPAQRRKRTLDACRALLLREAQVQPTIVVFEDLHWMDSESLAFVDSLIESLPKAALLVLVNFRPEFRANWGGKSYYTLIRIDPLPPQGAGELLRDRLGDDSSLHALRQLLIERTEGNPFFLEESARTLIESGALVGRRGDYRLVTPLTAIALPVTVQSVLAARIDRLGPEDKRLLQSASVIGKDFALNLLGEIADTDADGLQRGLANLQAAEFVYETRLFPEPEYTFSHALTQEVAYGGLLAERRQTLHASIVEAIERLNAGRLVEQVDRLAYHAGRGAVWEKAYAYGLQAGRRASERSANRAALTAFDAALDALGRLPETPERLAANIDLRFELRDAYFVLNELEAILPHLERAEALARQIGDRRRHVFAALYMCAFHWSVGQAERALEHGKIAKQLADELGDADLCAMARYRLGTLHIWFGDFRAAADVLGEALAELDNEAGRALFRFGGLVFVFVSTFLAWALAELGEFAAAEQVGLRGMRIAEDAQQGYSISVMSFGLAYTLLYSERWDRAIPVLERGMELADVHGMTATIGWIVSKLAFAHAAAGNAAEAKAALDRSAEPKVQREMQDGGIHVWVAGAHLMLGATDAAAEQAERALHLARRTGERGSEGWALRVAGEIALARGQADAAAVAFRAALGIAEALGMRPLALYCHRGLGAAARLARREAEAGAEFAAAQAIGEELGVPELAAEPASVDRSAVKA
jgi:class 3 adenylate cyclase/tetratricopeptide (TPR) repeat protein